MVLCSACPLELCVYKLYLAAAKKTCLYTVTACHRTPACWVWKFFSNVLLLSLAHPHTCLSLLREYYRAVCYHMGTQVAHSLTHYISLSGSRSLCLLLDHERSGSVQSHTFTPPHHPTHLTPHISSYPIPLPLISACAVFTGN